MLTRRDRHAIKMATKLVRVKLVRVKKSRDGYGYPDRLLQAQDNRGGIWRGWWYEGESAEDIKWDTADADGWPEGCSSTQAAGAHPSRKWRACN